MPAISFLMQPEMGHILPTLRIAQKLTRRGHTVRFFGLNHFRDLIELGNAIFIPVLGKFGPAQTSSPLFGGSISTERLFRSEGSQPAISTKQLWAEVSGIVGSYPSDLLVVDSGIFTSASASVLGSLRLPLLRINTSLPDSRQVDIKALVIPEIILCPASLELPKARVPSHPHAFVEPSAFRGRPDLTFPDPWRDPSKLLIYCSLGTQSHLYSQRDALIETVVRTFAPLSNVQLLVATGAQQIDKALEGLSPNVKLCHHVDQLKALEYASLFITHGGLGSVKEGILGGVPLLVLPFSFDQPLNAQRVDFHRIGGSLVPTLWNSEQIRRLALQIIGDRTIHANMCRFRDDFRAQEDLAPSIAHIEELCAGHRSDRTKAPLFRG